MAQHLGVAAEDLVSSSLEIAGMVEPIGIEPMT